MNIEEALIYSSFTNPRGAEITLQKHDIDKMSHYLFIESEEGIAVDLYERGFHFSRLFLQCDAKYYLLV